jgi:hypothetical protein
MSTHMGKPRLAPDVLAKRVEAELLSDGVIPKRHRTKVQHDNQDDGDSGRCPICRELVNGHAHLS